MKKSIFTEYLEALSSFRRSSVKKTGGAESSREVFFHTFTCWEYSIFSVSIIRRSDRKWKSDSSLSGDEYVVYGWTQAIAGSIKTNSCISLLLHFHSLTHSHGLFVKHNGILKSFHLSNTLHSLFCSSRLFLGVLVIYRIANLRSHFVFLLSPLSSGVFFDTREE